MWWCNGASDLLLNLLSCGGPKDPAPYHPSAPPAQALLQGSGIVLQSLYGTFLASWVLPTFHARPSLASAWKLARRPRQPTRSASRSTTMSRRRSELRSCRRRRPLPGHDIPRRDQTPTGFDNSYYDFS